jgi:hypothetical protein
MFANHVSDLLQKPFTYPWMLKNTAKCVTYRLDGELCEEIWLDGALGCLTDNFLRAPGFVRYSEVVFELSGK